MIAINSKINRAMAGAAAAMGATLKITDRAGYAPLNTDPRMSELFCEAANLLDPEHPIQPNPNWSTGCTDMGDISCLMPAIHPYCKGAAGPAHHEDYAIASFDKACMNSVKVQLILLELLLENDAAKACEIVRQFKPVYPSLEAYMADLDSLMIDKDAVTMNPDGTALLQ